MIKLANAQELGKLYHETFTAPNKKILDRIKIGDYVKVATPEQVRFWVFVTDIKGNEIQAIMAYNQPDIGGLKYRDPITVNKDNVYDIHVRVNTAPQ